LLQALKKEINEKDAEVQEKNKELILKDGELQEMKQKIEVLQKEKEEYQQSYQGSQVNLQNNVNSQDAQQKDQLLLQKDQQLQQKDQQLQQKDQQLLQKDKQLQQKDQQIIEKDHCIYQKDEQLKLKDEQILEKDENLKQKDQILYQKDQNLQQKYQEIQEKDHLLIQKDRQLQQLQKPTWAIQRQDVIVLEKKLGTGGWGSVKEAILHGCKVAVKSLDNEIVSPYNLELFSREMNMASRCRHPNLMQFIGATTEGVPLIVTELMHTSLRKVLHQGQLYSNQIIPILLGVAYGLNYLHKTTPYPMLHRDVSSANVLLNPLPNNQWHPKLSDFGSTNFMRASTTFAPGSAAYAAPEALAPQGPHTPAMDVFSFGVLMYEMCSRKFPTEKPTPSTLNQDTWGATESKLVDKIKSCLLPDYHKRPTMGDLINRLS